MYRSLVHVSVGYLLSQTFQLKTIEVGQLCTPGLVSYPPIPCCLFPLGVDVSSFISLAKLLLPCGAGDTDLKVC